MKIPIDKIFWVYCPEDKEDLHDVFYSDMGIYGKDELQWTHKHEDFLRQINNKIREQTGLNKKFWTLYTCHENHITIEWYTICGKTHLGSATDISKAICKIKSLS